MIDSFCSGFKRCFWISRKIETRGVCGDRWERVTVSMLTSRHALNMELNDWDAVPNKTCIFLQAHGKRGRVKTGSGGTFGKSSMRGKC